jgi:hypothetical protein
MPKLPVSPENPDDPQPIRSLIDGFGHIPNPEPKPKSGNAPMFAPESASPPQPASLSEFETELELEAFRVDQDFAQHIQTVKKPISIPVGRPHNQEWICFHPNKSWRIVVNLLEDRINRRFYLVARHLFPEVMSDLRPKLLVAYAVRRDSSWGLWPIRVKGERGDLDSYSESLHGILGQYSGQWIRVLTDQPGGVYVPVVTENVEAPVPRWPDGGFQYLFQLAFKNRVINGLDHPILRGLRGEI